MPPLSAHRVLFVARLLLVSVTGTLLLSSPAEKTMYDVKETEALKVYQYQLKARVHEMPDARYRALVEFGVRTARGFDTKLHYCSLVRTSWADALEDAENMLETLRLAHCKDAECNVVSVRGSTAFDTFMALAASVRKTTSPKLVSHNNNGSTKRPARRAQAPKLAPVATEAATAGVVVLRRHA